VAVFIKASGVEAEYNGVRRTIEVLQFCNKARIRTVYYSRIVNKASHIEKQITSLRDTKYCSGGT